MRPRKLPPVTDVDERERLEAELRDARRWLPILEEFGPDPEAQRHVAELEARLGGDA